MNLGTITDKEKATKSNKKLFHKGIFIIVVFIIFISIVTARTRISNANVEDNWWDKATKSEKTAFCIGFMMGEVELSAPVSGAGERFYNISAPKYYRKFGSEPNWNMVTKGYKMGLTTNAPPEVVNSLKTINQICNVILQKLNNPYAS